MRLLDLAGSIAKCLQREGSEFQFGPHRSGLRSSRFALAAGWMVGVQDQGDSPWSV